MRHEPIEIGSAIRSLRRRGRRRAARLAGASAPTIASSGAPAAEIVDEAFADFAAPASPTLQQGLVAELSSQLESLDRQREQLSKLLRSIDAAAIAP